MPTQFSIGIDLEELSVLGRAADMQLVYNLVDNTKLPVGTSVIWIPPR